MTARARVLAPALFVAAAALSGMTALSGIQPNDEGLMLQAAARIAHGQVPLRDFWWFYPPGQPYLLGALWAVFGPSLVAWRIVRVLADATVALLAWRLARRWAPPRLAVAGWLAAALAMAYPSGPHPFPIALALALGALLACERSPLAAGVLAGLCALWRIEFAVYLVAGLLVQAAVTRRRRDAARMVVPALAVPAVLYAPLVAAAGIGTSWRLLVRYPAVQFSRYQSLPFPLGYPKPLQTASVGAFLNDSLQDLLLFYLPLVLVVGLVAALIAVVARRRARQAAAAVFAVGMAHYLVIRPDLFHTAPLAVMVAVLAPSTVGATRWLRPLAAVAIAAVAFAIVEGADRRYLSVRDYGVPLRLSVADGVHARASVARPLRAAVRWVDAHVARGAPIYVTGRRADIVTSGAPLFYVLAARANPTRYDIAAPGVVTTAPVQRELVAALARARPPVVVRWTDPVTAAREPNRSGRSSGVRILDAFVAARYALAARYGDYLLLTLRR